MHVQVRLDANTIRRWHVRLLERLRERSDCEVSVALSSGLNKAQARIEFLFRLETAAYGLARPGPASCVGADAVQQFRPEGAEAPDLVIDLCGDAEVVSCKVWRLAFNDMYGEYGLLAALLAGQAPIATLRDATTIVATAQLGTEAPGVLVASFEDCLCRATTLILAGLDGAASQALPPFAGRAENLGNPARFGYQALAHRAAKTLAKGAIRQVYRRCCYSPHWRVGWRHIDGPDLVTLGRHPEQGWNVLFDDGLRFYADPFPIEHKGQVTLFVEEFDHRKQKGVISAMRFGPGGPLGRPEVVLERGYHLSYPFVFEQDGDVWMVPESCAAGRIDLYRAAEFPRDWVHEAVLVDGIVASDATLLQHQGRWWMFATVRDDNAGAFSDSLHLWSAVDFRGPWKPHAKNPVLVDIASARPAGRIVRMGESLIRPVQDCRKGYGQALGFARIVRLDDEAYEQEVVSTVQAGALWEGRRIHTVNKAGGYEFIDGSAVAWRRFFPKAEKPRFAWSFG